LYLPKRGYGVLTATTLWWDATDALDRTLKDVFSEALDRFI